METPKNTRQSRPARNPTPRLSERKKSLFSKDASKEDIGDDFLKGFELLDSMRDDTIVDDSSSSTRSRGIGTILGAGSRSHIISFFKDEAEKEDKHEKAPTRRSLRVMLPKMSMGAGKGDKENTPRKDKVEEGPEEQLQKLFNSSMRLGAPRHNLQIADELTESINSLESSEKEEITLRSVTEGHKRHAEQSLPELSPHKKMAKLTGSPHSLSISTKTFYSAPKTSLSSPANSFLESTKDGRTVVQTSTSPSSNISPRTRARQEKRGIATASINKGVRHKIRRRSRPFGSGTGACHLPSLDVDVILKNMRNEKLKKLIVSKREERLQIEKVHSIFRNSQNPIAMARPLSIISSQDDSNNNDNSTCSKQIPSVEYEVEVQSKEANEEAYVDFSDIEYDSGEQDEEELQEAIAKDEVIPLVRHKFSEVEAAVATIEEERPKSPLTNRKFFKTGRTFHTPKEVKITDNIRASVYNGKISLVQEQKKIRKRPKAKQIAVNEFSDEQATVEAILRNLDDTAFGDIIETIDTEVIPTRDNQLSEPESEVRSMEAEDLFLEEIQLHDNLDYAKFRERLPYNTSDPEIAEQQHLLLDFLISNNICTEENFTIFIADPDNNKEKAARIVDQVILVVNEHSDYRQRVPYNTTDPELTAQQHRMLDFLIENGICTEENFDIFIANYERRRSEAENIMATIEAQNRNATSMECTSDDRDNETHLTALINTGNVLPVSTNTTVRTSEKLFPIFYPERWKPLEQKSRRRLPRIWCGGVGATQYQIDLGQRDFGAQQCKQCGLVYSVHEPEEEKLHREYHTSLHVLRFKGWIDEDIVAIYPEWGPDGRILRLTERSHLKRRERLADILHIVDKELGFSSYVIPNTFVAYLAVRKHQFVGLCLVQPLDKANKYFCIDGVDCCSEEQFPAKCGISRIWVSPLHRRLRIASKLIQVVQQNTIFGEEIPLDRIAFSAPTESGKLFAQKVTLLENFLVYQ